MGVNVIKINKTAHKYKQSVIVSFGLLSVVIWSIFFYIVNIYFDYGIPGLALSLFLAIVLFTGFLKSRRNLIPIIKENCLHGGRFPISIKLGDEDITLHYLEGIEFPVDLNDISDIDIYPAELGKDRKLLRIRRKNKCSIEIFVDEEIAAEMADKYEDKVQINVFKGM